MSLVLHNLTDRVAIVTGGGSGIGQAIAHRFARHGASVVIFERDELAGTATAHDIQAEGGKAEVVACDVADAPSVDAAVAAVEATHGRIDILVNNAGVAHVGTATTTEPEDFDRLYRVNVRGVYFCLRAVLPRMTAHGGGAIVNLASIASVVGIKDRFAYSMTKGAVLTMTYSVAADYIDHGVRCNCVCPARVHTPFVDGFIRDNYPGREGDVFETLSKYQPIGRMGQPEEVASFVLYLCSDEASFLTGCAYPIDGGVVNLR